MKITKQQLQQIIKEEMEAELSEDKYATEDDRPLGTGRSLMSSKDAERALEMAEELATAVGGDEAAAVSFDPILAVPISLYSISAVFNACLASLSLIKERPVPKGRSSSVAYLSSLSSASISSLMICCSCCLVIFILISVPIVHVAF